MLIININKSSPLAIFIALAGALSAVLVLASGFPLAISLPLVGLVIMIGDREIRHIALLRGTRSIIRLAIRDGAVEIWPGPTANAGDGIRCQLVSQLVTAELVALVMRSEVGGRRYRTMLIRGMCGDGEFSRLKRELRLRNKPLSATF